MAHRGLKSDIQPFPASSNSGNKPEFSRVVRRRPIAGRLHRVYQRRLRDALLHGEIFYSLNETRIVIETWRVITPPAPDPNLSPDLVEQRYKFALAMGVGLGKDGFQLIARRVPGNLQFSGGDLRRCAARDDASELRFRRRKPECFGEDRCWRPWPWSHGI